MSVDTIIKSWKQKDFKPIYWFDGEEDYYIDKLMDYAEQKLLTPEEASFNLTIFYGRDAEWSAILNACKKYPMFSDKQVVLLKEAQMMKELDKLEPYFKAPLHSTVFIIGFKGKGPDKRKSIYKTITSFADCTNFKKIPENKLFDWINELVLSKGLQIKPKAVTLLEEHLGADLNRISNEVEKLSINLGNKKEIDEQDIEKYIGISKEYNAFELQEAIATKNLHKALKIVSYFEANPKAGPIQMVLPLLYSFFSRVYSVYGINNPSDAVIKPIFYYNVSSIKHAKDTMSNYGFSGIEKIILLLHHYNLKSLGIDDGKNSSAQLMREMIAKIMLA